MADTLAARKLAFLDAQVRILSAPLELPDASEWRVPRRRNADPDDNESADLPAELVSEVLNDVNDHLRKHNHAAFSPAALAHVAAQIDALREHAAAEAFAQRPVPSLTRADAGGARSRHLSRQIDPSVREDGTIERGVVLTSDVIIAAMPDTWPGADAEGPISDGTGGHRRRQQPPENSASRLSALEAFAGEQDYASRLRRLRELREDRDEARGRLAQLQQLTQLLQPLEDPGAQVQPNLVGREGEVGKELERMRVLVERVSGKVTHW